MGDDVPNLATVTEAVAYARVLRAKSPQGNGVAQQLRGKQHTAADTLDAALANKVNAVKSSIRSLPGADVSNLDSVVDLGELVSQYATECRRVLTDKFQTLKRNKAFTIIVSDSNVVAEIIKRTGVVLPIRTKNHIFSRRGAMDIIQNKAVDLSYRGQLTNSINLLLQSDAHELYLLLAHFDEL